MIQPVIHTVMMRIVYICLVQAHYQNLAAPGHVLNLSAPSHKPFIHAYYSMADQTSATNVKPGLTLSQHDDWSGGESGDSNPDSTSDVESHPVLVDGKPAFTFSIGKGASFHPWFINQHISEDGDHEQIHGWSGLEVQVRWDPRTFHAAATVAYEAAAADDCTDIAAVLQSGLPAGSAVKWLPPVAGSSSASAASSHAQQVAKPDEEQRDWVPDISAWDGVDLNTLACPASAAAHARAGYQVVTARPATCRDAAKLMSRLETLATWMIDAAGHGDASDAKWHLFLLLQPCTRAASPALPPLSSAGHKRARESSVSPPRTPGLPPPLALRTHSIDPSATVLPDASPGGVARWQVEATTPVDVPDDQPSIAGFATVYAFQNPTRAAQPCSPRIAQFMIMPHCHGQRLGLTLLHGIQCWAQTRGDVWQCTVEDPAPGCVGLMDAWALQQTLRTPELTKQLPAAMQSRLPARTATPSTALCPAELPSCPPGWLQAVQSTLQCTARQAHRTWDMLCAGLLYDISAGQDHSATAPLRLAFKARVFQTDGEVRAAPAHARKAALAAAWEEAWPAYQRAWASACKCTA